MPDLFDLDTPALLPLLPEATRAALLAAGTPVHYRDGALVHARGDRKPGLSVVRSGTVRIGNPGSDGSYVTTSILGPGHCFGEFTLFANLPRTHDVVAIGDVVIDQIPRPRFMALYHEDRNLSWALLCLATRRIHALVEFAEDLRRLPLPVQLAKHLLAMTRGSTGPGSVGLVQDDLASLFGVSRVSIGKALRRLVAEDLLNLGYGRIEIPDRARLADWLADRTVLMPLERDDDGDAVTPGK
ncbi:Crp/Fnr family transcriptional regulator [Zavarzinia compransoris]|uniref:Crp/Fnr family transcriptional regulator n=1 Tax=Zavarzinia marina TaxID=2911065 RepID=UPI001F4090F7|nr:Crp/Fnr family transcriptional regulator [Zavarzinia marina]MCF4164498.1 Crp/Fnr family transcriptional regulator [Zavarzinia marina]